MAAKKTAKKTSKPATSTIVPGYVSSMPKKPDGFILKVAKEMHAETVQAFKQSAKIAKAATPKVAKQLQAQTASSFKMSATSRGKTVKASTAVNDIAVPWSKLDPMFRDGYYFQAERVLHAMKRVEIAEANKDARKLLKK